MRKTTPGDVREFALLALVFVSSRLILHWAGLRLNFSLDWMWLSDPDDLQHDLLRTIYYFHAFPPGMDLLTGVLLKIAGARAAAVALALFWGLGLILVGALYYLLRTAALSPRVALPVAIAFSLLPQSIYFEHLYLYEEPVAALLCLSVALFHAALGRQSFWLWVAFFTVCAAIGITRSTFHLIWFAAMLVCAIWFNRTRVPRILAAASAPAALLLALYVKNLVVFGTFGALTYGPASYTNVTVSRLPVAETARLIREHRLSPFAAVSPFAGPREHLRVFHDGPQREWPRQLTELDRPTVHAPNFNHWVLLEANRQRAADAWYYVRTRPVEYLHNVARGLRDLFTPSTEWHAYTGTERSPHYQHRLVLGRYEAFVNGLFHRFPVAPIGLYVFLPVVMVLAGIRARQFVRSRDPVAVARGAMLGVSLLNIAYVVAVSSLFTFLESARYRYQVESLIWLTAALSLDRFAGLRRWGADGLAGAASGDADDCGELRDWDDSNC